MCASRLMSIVVTILALSGCQPEQDSQLATLDNFANKGEVTMHQCHGNYPVLEQAMMLTNDLDPSRIKDAGLDAISAIPPRLQRLFFVTDRGAIVANDKFDRVCGAAAQKLSPIDKRFVQEGTDGLNACVEYIEAIGSVMIRLKPERKQVQHHLVRTFAHHLATRYGPKTFANWERSVQDLALVFVDEVMASRKYTIEPYIGMMGSDSGIAQFRQFVFAEAFDSFYCNAETRKSFRSEFPRTFRAFQVFANAFKG